MAQYPEDFIKRLEIIWGEGFLSPGGPEEVREIMRGLDLTGKRVLDIGSGVGGPAMVLARDLGAEVVGVDIEPQLIERSTRLAAAAGLSDTLSFKLVEPGPLPFEEGVFDVVFSKDSLIHVPDKKALYREVLRVLTPGGLFAASDWLSGAGAAEDPHFRRYMELGHLEFVMATAEETAEAMRSAGFEAVETRDRNGWYVDVSAREAAEVEGPLRESIIAASSAETYDGWRERRHALAAAVKAGALRPTHLRGRRPTG